MAAVFRGFWHGPLPLLHRACLQSFVSCGHSFELYAYDRLDAGPGIAVCDAAAVMPRSEVFYYENPITNEPDIAPFSDLFRLKVLRQRGGWWCDVDTFCLSHAMPECRYAWARDNPEFHPGYVYNGLLHFPPGDDIPCAAYRRCSSLRAELSRRGQLGAEVLSQLIAERSLPLDMTVDGSTVCPLRWIEMFKLWLPEFSAQVERKLGAALLLPVYWSFAKHVGIDVDVLPPEGSVLRQLVQRHSPEPTLPRRSYAADEIRALAADWFWRQRDWAVPELNAACGAEAIDWLQPHRAAG